MNKTEQDNKSNDKYKVLTESMERSQKQEEETFIKINEKLDQKMSTTKDTIWSLIKEILQKNLQRYFLRSSRKFWKRSSLEKINQSKRQHMVTAEEVDLRKKVRRKVNNLKVKKRMKMMWRKKRFQLPNQK
eukprot:1410301-Ditylum_brightwellii.AAC.1